MKDLAKIFELIPQRLPMVMVDEHIYTNKNKTQTRFSVVSDSFFCEDGCLSEAGILENMAQSAAARLGYSFIANGKGNPPIGIIATMQDIQILEFPKAGNDIFTEITFVDEIMGITLVDCKTFCNKKEIAFCKMKILLRE
ncbi:MAG: hydroxymyristoyl-ACP dehydratase [Bacteroidetes bacterium]|nr:hydroxymyristoyl-ACP dehydratase [Bacteroidota bacterium]PIX32281.1 MAG: hydroxymyristoyl-ACP dehydratase [Bacteroidetes bacterium CG_4_8_14_3_um_filter_31_14]